MNENEDRRGGTSYLFSLQLQVQVVLGLQQGDILLLQLLAQLLRLLQLGLSLLQLLFLLLHLVLSTSDVQQWLYLYM